MRAKATTFSDGELVVVVVAPVEAFDVGVVVLEEPELGDDGDAGAVVVGEAGLKAIAALNSRPIESVTVSARAAGTEVHVDV